VHVQWQFLFRQEENIPKIVVFQGLQSFKTPEARQGKDLSVFLKKLV
jgi:hypothetical protein